MQRTCVFWFAFTVVIYVLSTVSTAHGRKCSGRWAIHACYGGNGKRSSPPSDSLENQQRNKQFLLGQLLLRNRSPVPEVISNNYPEDSSLLDTDTVYQDSDTMVRQQILERVNSILSDMLLNRRLQDAEDDMEPYY